MGNLTDELPKCRSLLHGTELIQWQLDSLHEAGATSIAIVTGYLSDTFDFDLAYFHNSRWAETNMVRTLMEAEEWLRQDTCIVAYADIVYLPQAVSDLAASPADLAITYDPRWLDLWSRRFDDPLDDAETFRLIGEHLAEIGGKPVTIEEIEGQFMGLLKFTPAGWASIRRYLDTLAPETLDKLDSTSLLKDLLRAGTSVHAVPVTTPWAEVDGEHDLRILHDDPLLARTWKEARAHSASPSKPKNKI